MYVCIELYSVVRSEERRGQEEGGKVEDLGDPWAPIWANERTSPQRDQEKISKYNINIMIIWRVWWVREESGGGRTSTARSTFTAGRSPSVRRAWRTPRCQSRAASDHRSARTASRAMAAQSYSAASRAVIF